ncbi:hypothetical protein M3Y98_00253700 [Aphelenchoides besseyi]|nr:hypothetical protein M3Y98_00253700 [Aphelenchoides besseyi]
MSNWTTNGIPASDVQLSVASLYGGINEQFASQPFDFFRSSTTPPSSTSDPPLSSSSISLNDIFQRPLYSPQRTPPRPNRPSSSNVELIDSSPLATWPSITGVLETPDLKHCSNLTARSNLSNIHNTMQSFVSTYSPFMKKARLENAENASFVTSNDSGIRPTFDSSNDSGIGHSFVTSNDSGVGHSFTKSSPIKPPAAMIYRPSPVFRSPVTGTSNSPLRTFFFTDSPYSSAEQRFSLTNRENSIVKDLQSPQLLTSSEKSFIEPAPGSMSCSNAVRIKTPRFTPRVKSIIYGKTSAQRELTLQAKKYLKRKGSQGYRTGIKLVTSPEELAKIDWDVETNRKKKLIRNPDVQFVYNNCKVKNERGEHHSLVPAEFAQCNSESRVGHLSHAIGLRLM